MATLSDHDKFRLARLDQEEAAWGAQKVTREARKGLVGTVVKAETLALGDVVRLAIDGEADQPFNSCTVIKKNAKNGDVTLFRPYVATADFSVSGGEPDASAVIAYIGSETFSIYATNTVRLLQLGDALK